MSQTAFIVHCHGVGRVLVEFAQKVPDTQARFTEEINPFTHRDRLPLLSGGLLGELAYGNKPVFIQDLPART